MRKYNTLKVNETNQYQKEKTKNYRPSKNIQTITTVNGTKIILQPIVTNSNEHNHQDMTFKYGFLNQKGLLLFDNINHQPKTHFLIKLE